MRELKLNFKTKAFTLVELGIAVVLASVISILLMTMMTRFQQTAVELSGRNKAANDSILIMYKLKNLIRNAKQVKTQGSAFTVTLPDGKTNEVTFDPQTGLISWDGDDVPMWDRSLGNGSLLSFNLESKSEIGSIKTPRVFKLTLKIVNPEAPHRDEPSLAMQKALVYSTIVSMRIPDLQKESDPSWVMNSQEECPPSCGSNSSED